MLKNSYNKTISFGLCVACLTGLTLFYIYHSLYWYDWVTDDAYITFRYAKNFCNGLGLVYNQGERIEGYSNFSWLILIALGIKAGFAPIMTARILSCLSGIGSILCMIFIYNKFSSKPYSFSLLLPVLLLSTNSYFCFWTLSGMETIFFSFLLILSIVLYLKENQKSHPFSAYVLGLICMTRPEGIGYIGIFLIVEALLRIRKKQKLNQYYYQFYSICFSILLAYFLFKLIYYNSLFPNTYYAKSWSSLQNRNIKYLLDFYFQPNFILIIILLIALLMVRQFPGSKILIPFLFFNWFFILYVPVDWMPNYRYHMYTLPILFTLVGLGFSELIRQLNLKKTLYASIAAVVMTILLGQYILKNIYVDKGMYKNKFKLVHKPTNWFVTVFDKVRKGIYPSLTHLAMFLIENSNENMTIGMTDIGFPAYINNCQVYDWAMLVNKKARNLFNVLKDDKKDTISDFISNNMRKDLENYAPDFFFYHPINAKRWRFKRWVNSERKFSIFARTCAKNMLENYLKTDMKAIKYNKWLKWIRRKRKKVFFVSYRKKQSKYKLSTSELIQKYKNIVEKYPHYPVFRKRLNELYEILARRPGNLLPRAVTYKNIHKI